MNWTVKRDFYVSTVAKYLLIGWDFLSIFVGFWSYNIKCTGVSIAVIWHYTHKTQLNRTESNLNEMNWTKLHSSFDSDKVGIYLIQQSYNAPDCTHVTET